MYRGSFPLFLSRSLRHNHHPFPCIHPPDIAILFRRKMHYTTKVGVVWRYKLVCPPGSAGGSLI